MIVGGRGMGTATVECSVQLETDAMHFLSVVAPDMVDQAIALARKPHVIVATPGRIVDHLENTKGFNLRQLKFLVG